MRAGWLLTMGAAVTSCVFGGAVTGASAPPGSQAAAGPVADAVAIVAGVEWRDGVGGTYAGVASSQPVAVGDGVRTDVTGFAEVAYGDGSRTRLDVSTEFEVVALSDDAGNAVTRTEMGVGRTWHRVESLGSGSGGFEVVTSQATVTVRGTAFLVSCPTADSCDYSVMEGVVDVALADGTVVTVTAPATLDVTAGVATGPVPLPWDGLFGDPWLMVNTDRDVQVGFADRATVYSAYGPAFASMVGSYEHNLTLSAFECVMNCPNAEEPGTASDPFVAAHTVDCDGGVCSILSESGVPYDFDGVTYSAVLPQEPNECVTDADGDGTFEDDEPVVAEYTTEAVNRMAPSAAEVRGDAYVVTSLVRHLVLSVLPGVPCEDGFNGYTATYDGTMTLVG